jgi:hypothetical protein
MMKITVDPVDLKAMSDAQNNPNWKFVGGTTIRRIQPGLGDLLVKAVGGPELPPETFMIGTMGFTFEDYAKKWPHAVKEDDLNKIKLISKPGQLGYVLLFEGETIENAAVWNQPQWYPKGFVETTYQESAHETESRP